MNINYLQTYRVKVLWVFCASFFILSCKTQLVKDSENPYKNLSISDSLSEDAYVNNFIQPYKGILDANLETTIAYTNIDLTSKGLSSNLGNVLADMVYNGAEKYAQKNNIRKPDFVVLNHGGMRVNIWKGDVKIRNLYEMMPFENTLVFVTLNAEQMQKLFDYMLETGKGHPLSHISLHYKNGKLSSALIDGVPFSPDRDYVVCTNNYLFTGGDNMEFFQPYVTMSETDLKIRDIFINEFSERKQIENNTEQRLIIE